MIIKLIIKYIKMEWVEAEECLKIFGMKTIDAIQNKTIKIWEKLNKISSFTKTLN
jgi:hypothetical protein|tara:strand:- start:233 stop:397 length:165 start_codon:yes stop_codon:yes gene_type:complete